MAAADSQHSAKASADRPVFLNRLDEVRTARWLEAAAVSKHPAEKPLIKSHQQDQNQRGNRDQESQELHRDFRAAIAKPECRGTDRPYHPAHDRESRPSSARQSCMIGTSDLFVLRNGGGRSSASGFYLPVSGNRAPGNYERARRRALREPRSPHAA